MAESSGNETCAVCCRCPEKKMPVSMNKTCLQHVSVMYNKCAAYCRWWSMAESNGNETCAVCCRCWSMVESSGNETCAVCCRWWSMAESSGNETCAVCCRWWSMALKAALAGTTWCTMLAGTQGESCLVLQNQLGGSTHGTSLFQDKWLVAPSICPDEADL